MTREGRGVRRSRLRRSGRWYASRSSALPRSTRSPHARQCARHRERRPQGPTCRRRPRRRDVRVLNPQRGQPRVRRASVSGAEASSMSPSLTEICSKNTAKQWEPSAPASRSERTSRPLCRSGRGSSFGVSRTAARTASTTSGGSSGPRSPSDAKSTFASPSTTYKSGAARDFASRSESDCTISSISPKTCASSANKRARPATTRS